MAEGEKFQHLRMQMVQHLKKCCTVTERKPLGRSLIDGTSGKRSLRLCQISTCADLQLSPPKSPGSSLGRPQPKGAPCSMIASSKKATQLWKKLIPGLGTFCGREVRDLDGAAISYIRATSDLPLHPTGERGLATSNCLHGYFECRQKS